MFSRINFGWLFLLVVLSTAACRTRLAGNLDGYVCDTATGVCHAKGDGSPGDGMIDGALGDSTLEHPDAVEKGDGPGTADGELPDVSDGGGAGGDGPGGDADAPAPSGTISITSPTGTVYVKASVAFTVGFGAGSTLPAAVEFLSEASSTPLATVAAPYAFTWDTTQVPEGTYHVTARAQFGPAIVSSAPVTVIVDRTPPTLVTRTPLPNATNVDLTLPSVVTFSEPLLAATVTTTTVQLSTGSTVVTSKMVLSADGKTITLSVTNRQAFTLPATVQQTLSSGITDLAGNSLSTTAWTWTAPLWISYGSVNGGSPDLAFDSKGRLLLTTTVERGAIGSGDYQVTVARHTGATSWDTSFGTPQGPEGSTFVGGPSAILAASDDNPIVAWSQFDSSNPADIHVAKWTGIAWNQSFATLSAEQGNGTGATRPRLAPAAAAGQFFVAWVENSQTYVSSVYAARWTGASWDLGYGGIAKIGAQQPGLGVGGDGQPVVTWTGTPSGGGLSRWNGTSWSSSPAYPTFGVVGLAFDSAQRPLVTQVNSSISSPSVSLFRYDADNDRFLAAGPLVPSGANPNGSRVATDMQGRALLAWSDSDGSTRNVHLLRLDGTTWDSSFGIVSAVDGAGTPADNPVLLVTPEGAPILAWEEKQSGVGSRPFTFIWKSNH